MQTLTVDERVDRVVPFLERAGFIDPAPDDERRARVRQVVQAAGDRIKVAGDILDYREFFQADDEFAYDGKAFDKRVAKEGVAELLARFRDRLSVVESFDAAALDAELRAFVDTEGITIGQVIHAVRVAATGKSVGFGLFDGLAILGREACLRRLDRALAATAGGVPPSETGNGGRS